MLPFRSSAHRRPDPADRLRRRYEPRFRTLQDRLRGAEQAVQTRTARSRQAMLNTGLTTLGAVLGAAESGKGKRAQGGVLGAFLGGGASKATTAARSAGRAAQSRQTVAHAEETVEAVQAQLQALEEEFQEELRKVEGGAGPEEGLEEVLVRPALNAISIRAAGLLWLPWGVDASGQPVPLWR